MGKISELLGLATFNVFLALILSAAFLTGSDKDGRVVRLTEAGITAFINEATALSSGRNKEVDSYGITAFFMDHVAENSQFRTTLRYNVSGDAEESRDLEMGKMDYISNMLQGLQTMAAHEAKTKIEYVSIDSSGRTATAVTTSRERGMMPVADDTGEAQMMPVTGISYCEQKLVLGDNHMIQMAGATCTTDIKMAEGL